MMNRQRPKLPLPIQERIFKFQEYVSRQYFADSRNWPLAKRRIQDVAESIVSTLKLEQPPIDLAKVVALFDLKVTQRPKLYENVSGQLMPTNTGYEIVVAMGSTNHLPTRWRFSLAHEIGHTLFFANGPHGPERIFPKQMDALSSVSRKEEGLCDSFAAALLAPTLLLAYLPNELPRMADIIQVSLKFEVTPDVLVRRLIYDLGYLGDKVVYAVRFTPNLRVKVFRGQARERNKKLPTANSVKSLLTNHNRGDYVAILKQEKLFADSEFCLYAGRTLYLLV